MEEGSSLKEVDLKEALSIWSRIREDEGYIFNLVDNQGNVVQFAFSEEVPKPAKPRVQVRADGSWSYVPPRNHLVNFPRPSGSYNARVNSGEVPGWIEKVFEVGADYRKFENLKFALSMDMDVEPSAWPWVFALLGAAVVYAAVFFR